MARTMVANLTGARLREVDHELPMIRGVEAVDSYLAAHKHEARILQHLFDQRRAGRQVPSLARISRVMIWSDGEMEFLLNAPPTAPEAPPRSDGRSGLVAATPSGGRDGRGRPGWSGGQPSSQRPSRPGDRRGNDGDDWTDVPRAGDGWSIVRPGDVLPMDPEAPRGTSQVRHVPEGTTQVAGEDVVAVVGGTDEPVSADVETSGSIGDTN